MSFYMKITLNHTWFMASTKLMLAVVSPTKAQARHSWTPSVFSLFPSVRTQSWWVASHIQL